MRSTRFFALGLSVVIVGLALFAGSAGAHNNPSFREDLLLTIDVSADPSTDGSYSEPFSLIDPSDPAKWSTLMRASWFWDHAFLFSNYHLEHHYFPRVPFYNLPRLHRLLTQPRRWRRIWPAASASGSPAGFATSAAVTTCATP